MGDLVTTVTTSPGVDSNVITESTTDTGVEVKRVTTEWASVVTPGVTLTDPVYQRISRVTIESEWEPFVYVDADGVSQVMPSTQLNQRKTTTEQLMGRQCATSLGFVWVQGGRFIEAAAILQTAEVLLEIFTWHDDCSPKQCDVYRSQHYAPLATATGYIYDDGTERLYSVWDLNGENEEGAPRLSGDKLWHDRTIWPEAATLDLALRGVGKLFSERWYLSAVGVESYGSVGPNTPNQAPISPIQAATQPVVGSPTLPQVFEEVLMAEYDATDASGYAKRTESPALLPYPENEAELISIAKRRIRRDHSDTLDIPHNAIPFLRVGDHVSVTNHARSLVNADAYVVAIKRTCNVLNGAMRQVTTVKIPPSWI